MRNPVFLCICSLFAFMLTSCGSNYSCICRLNNVIDTEINLNTSSEGNAHNKCDAIKTLKPADTCGILGVGYH